VLVVIALLALRTMMFGMDGMIFGRILTMTIIILVVEVMMRVLTIPTIMAMTQIIVIPMTEELQLLEVVMQNLRM
jgi:hypothetical protein